MVRTVRAEVLLLIPLYTIVPMNSFGHKCSKATQLKAEGATQL